MVKYSVITNRRLKEKQYAGGFEKSQIIKRMEKNSKY